MSTRAILNKTSQKKRDHMLSFSNTTASDPFSPLPSPLAPPSCHSEPDPPSPPSSYSYGMQLDAPPKIPTDNVAVRSTCPFARRNRYLPLALRERITLETNNSAPWQWRRICFTSKDDFGQRDPDTSDYFRRTSNGMVRLVRAQNEVTYLQDQLFEGQRNQDWLSMITAPVSTRHYSIKYDKTRVIKSQNNSGLTHNYKLWHPMRSNIQYDGEQAGETLIDAAVSATGRRGMGNYYIVGYFQEARSQ